MENKEIYNEICHYTRTHSSNVESILRRLKNNVNELDEAVDCLIEECEILKKQMSDLRENHRIEKGVITCGEE